LADANLEQFADSDLPMIFMQSDGRKWPLGEVLVRKMNDR